MNVILKRIEKIFMGHSNVPKNETHAGREKKAGDGHVQPRLDTQIAKHAEVQAGEIHVVPLTTLARRKLGHDHVGTSQVRRVAAEVLDAYLGAADTYVIDRTGQATVLMPGVTHDVGERRLSAIASTIMARLREGQHPKPAVNVKTAVTTHHRSAARRGDSTRTTRPHTSRARAAAAVTPDGVYGRADVGPHAETLRETIRNEGWDLRGQAVTTSADPVWRTSVGYITAHIARPVAITADNARRRLAPDDLRNLPDRERVDLDAHILAEAVDRIDGAACNAAGGLQIAPLALRSLEREPYRDRMFALLNELNERERHLLVTELVDVPSPAPARRVAESCGRLATRCRGVWCRLPVTVTDFSWLRRAGAAGVGTDLTGTGRSERELLRSLETFAAAGERENLPCYVLGLPSVALTSAALAAGFAYVGGTALDRDHTDESGIAVYRLDDLYRASRRPEPDDDR